MSTVASSRDTFTVAPSFVMHLIKSQAGSMGKAIVECVQNSIDAGATTVEIETSTDQVVVSDDGRGFRSREEINQWFKVFGFSHEGLEREFGKFGLGRGQLWAFAETKWRTNTFELRVDVQKQGLDYDVIEGLPVHAGTRIEATMYERMRTTEVVALERELMDLCEFVQVPVLLNGKRISKDPQEVKWTHETEDVWLRLVDRASTLTFYNMGVKVRSYSSYHFGVGGIVVTKPGKRLELNTARNDILVASCPVFKRLKPLLQRKSDEEVKRTARLTEEQMGNLARRFVAGEIQYEEIKTRKLITDVCGAKHTIAKFIDRAAASADKVVTVCASDGRAVVAEESLRNNHCFVLSALTLDRFGVVSVEELLNRLKEAFGNQEQRPFWMQHRYGGPNGLLSGLEAEEDWRKACKSLENGYKEIPPSEWTANEKAVMAALDVASPMVKSLIERCGCVEEGDDENFKRRRLLLGVSGVAEAWTDGVGKLWLNRSILKRVELGLGGFVSLVGVMVHEYLHQSSSTGTHSHDQEFYERMERAMLFDDAEGGGSATVGSAAQAALSRYARECGSTGVRMERAAKKDLDRVEEASAKLAA